jgi:16S rRNA (cytosine1402-N4)-methyltransferase
MVIEYKHISVMLNEVLEYLSLEKGDMAVDCTFGGGGYTEAILNIIGDTGKVLAIDRDRLAIENGLEKFRNQKNLTLINNKYSEIKTIIEEAWGEGKLVDAIVMDLGLSSAQLDDRARGFSFLHDGELKMEMSGEDSQVKTIDIVNTWRQNEIEKILREYGEERYARNIAKHIVAKRKDEKIIRTKQLVEIIASAIPALYRNNKKIHFATRTFQALRIATNEELDGLEKVLPQAIDLLSPGGRLVVVSFHSLEDRIVKRAFKKESIDCICPVEIPICRCEHEAKIKIINKKLITPSEEEIRNNPRSRSAKMRVAEKKG